MDSLNPGFKYTPLDPAVDSIRLLVLEPITRSRYHIFCRLEHVTFGQRPRYEALSYTWGDQKPSLSRYTICVDNKLFQIQDNLWDALFQLRSDTLERILWVDAVCIDQDDIQERNRQVRIMPHIYSRAECVLVWLGKFPREVAIEAYLWSSKSLEDMCSRDYWNRVWIIQEIGKARRIQILVEKQRISWDRFIAAVKKLPNLANSRPVRLANGLLDKYGNGHKLHTLLSEHSQALCKDPRDKIYGLIGLAIDCDSRFPIGYDKDSCEIWEDAVVYQNRNPMAQKNRIVEFSTLVRDLLSEELTSGTNKGYLWEDRKAEMWTENGNATEKYYLLDIRHPSSIMTPALVSGMIIHLGPTCEEIISKLEKVDEWTSSIKYYCPMPYLRNAYEENDRYLKLVEKMQGSDFDVHSFEVKVSHPLDNMSMANLDTSRYQNIPSATNTPESMPGKGDNKYTTNGRLFIMEPGDYGRRKSSATIGRAPPETKVGDFICHFYAMSRAVVVRRNGDFCQIVGTAILGQDEILYNDDDMVGPGQPFVNLYLHLFNLYFDVT